MRTGKLGSVLRDRTRGFTLARWRRYQCDGLYDLNPLFGKTSNVVTFAKNFGGYSEVYNGVDFTTRIRLPHGLQ
jgi:hypothetical protein